MNIPFDKLSPADLMLCSKLADRMIDLALEVGVPLPPECRLSLHMDISTAHLSRPLKLQQLLMASNEDLSHDVLAIARNIDRQAGRLPDWLHLRFEATRQ